MSEHMTARIEVQYNRKPTIEDIRYALDVLRAEGIPESFEVDVVSSEEREYEEGVPYEDRKRVRVFRISAERSAQNPPATDRPADGRDGGVR